MFIRSKRLFLRPGWPEDADELAPLIGEAAVARQLVGVPLPCSADDARAFLALPVVALLPQLCITLPSAAGTRLVGGIGLRREHGEVTLDCWIGRPHWGRGYATEATRALLAQARLLGHRRIIAWQFVDNPASARVLAKAGFRPTGEARQRHSLARGGAALALTHSAILEPACYGDNHPDDSGEAVRHAA